MSIKESTGQGMLEALLTLTMLSAFIGGFLSLGWDLYSHATVRFLLEEAHFCQQEQRSSFDCFHDLKRQAKRLNTSGALISWASGDAKPSSTSSVIWDFPLLGRIQLSFPPADKQDLKGLGRE